MTDRKTLKFGSMKDMANAGLALVAGDGKIDELFFKNGDLIKRYCLCLGEEFSPPDNAGPILVGDGAYLLAPGVDFRGKTADTWRFVVCGEEQDEVFYLIIWAHEAQAVDGGFVPEGVGMDVYFRDGCGRPGLEATLYKLVAERFERFIETMRS